MRFNRRLAWGIGLSFSGIFACLFIQSFFVIGPISLALITLATLEAHCLAFSYKRNPLSLVIYLFDDIFILFLALSSSNVSPTIMGGKIGLFFALCITALILALLGVQFNLHASKRTTMLTARCIPWLTFFIYLFFVQGNDRGPIVAASIYILTLTMTPILMASPYSASLHAVTTGWMLMPLLIQNINSAAILEKMDMLNTAVSNLSNLVFGALTGALQGVARGIECILDAPWHFCLFVAVLWSTVNWCRWTLRKRVKPQKSEITENHLYNNNMKRKENYMTNWDAKNNRPRVLLDFDDVVGDFLGHLLEVFNKQNNSDIKIDEFKEWDMSKTCGPEIFEVFKKEGFFTEIPEKNNSIRVLRELIESAKYDVYIVTACTTIHELQEKVDWMAKRLPGFNKNRIIMCSEKSIVRGDVIVDDRLKNLDECAVYMKTIVYDMPHNRENQTYQRIHSLEELPDILHQMFYQ